MTTTVPPTVNLWSRLRHLATLIGTTPVDHPHRAQVVAQVDRLEQLVVDCLQYGIDVRTGGHERWPQPHGPPSTRHPQGAVSLATHATRYTPESCVSLPEFLGDANAKEKPR